MKFSNINDNPAREQRTKAQQESGKISSTGKHTRGNEISKQLHNSIKWQTNEIFFAFLANNNNSPVYMFFFFWTWFDRKDAILVNQYFKQVHWEISPK